MDDNVKQRSEERVLSKLLFIIMYTYVIVLPIA